MAGSPETEAQLTFTDVAKGQWYYDAVVWASANGITMGIDETHFAPNDPVTREQMVTFFARFAKLNGIDTSYQGQSVRLYRCRQGEQLCSRCHELGL